MRAIEAIEQDLERCEKQISATLNGSMSAMDSQITLQGFMQQKEKLKKELKDAEQLAQRAANGMIVISPTILN
tara:strand:+ start:158 stop:376 length:219 start_codon:yes stop_codon:yes gene_type:complete